MKTLNEEWRIVEDAPQYEVSNLGNIRHIKRKQNRKLQVCNSGYQTVGVKIDGKLHLLLIHRLVAKAFIPNPENKEQVNHIDENKFNNTVSNLEWATPKENANHGTRNERINNKEKQGKKVFCVELNKTFSSIGEAAKETGLWRSNICSCCRGVAKTTGGYHWRYAENV